MPSRPALNGDPNTVTAALINGKQCFITHYDGTGSPVVSGNAVFNASTQTIIITGDCTIKAFSIR